MDNSNRLLPKIGLAVFIRREGRILLGHRIGSHGAHTWALPGGHLEFGESFQTCAEREVLEETGMHIGLLRPVGFTNDMFEQENKHYVTLFFLTDESTSEPKILEPEKCLEWKWCAWDNLPQPLFLPLQNFLKQGISFPT